MKITNNLLKVNCGSRYLQLLNNLIYIGFQIVHPRPLFRFFRAFSTNLWKKSICRWESNSQPLKHPSHSITARPSRGTLTIGGKITMWLVSSLISLEFIVLIHTHNSIFSCLVRSIAVHGWQYIFHIYFLLIYSRLTEPIE